MWQNFGFSVQNLAVCRRYVIFAPTSLLLLRINPLIKIRRSMRSADVLESARQSGPLFTVSNYSIMERNEEQSLTLLGNKKTAYKKDYSPEVLETFINKHPENDYWVKFNCPEFTSLCPITGQPDFADIIISYIPDVRMVESKSLKLYLFSFRNHGDFHEDCVNVIMKDLIRLMEPRYIEVTGVFTPRGGIAIHPFANYGRPGTKFEQLAWERLSRHE